MSNNNWYSNDAVNLIVNYPKMVAEKLNKYPSTDGLTAEAVTLATQELLYSIAQDIETVLPKIATSADDVTDGYHTVRELYEHRHALFIALMASNSSKSWYSFKHSDGSPCFDGYFLAGIHLPTGDISYHLPIDKLPLIEGKLHGNHIDTPTWDGHTSKDVVDRLNQFSA